HRIRQLRAPKEPYIDVSREHIGVCKRCITDARGGVTVMQQLPDIGITIPHPPEPLSRDCAEPRWSAVKPRINGGGSRDRGGKQQQLTHGDTSRVCHPALSMLAQAPARERGIAKRARELSDRRVNGATIRSQAGTLFR